MSEIHCIKMLEIKIWLEVGLYLFLTNFDGLFSNFKSSIKIYKKLVGHLHLSSLKCYHYTGIFQNSNSTSTLCG